MQAITISRPRQLGRGAAVLAAIVAAGAGTTAILAGSGTEVSATPSRISSPAVIQPDPVRSKSLLVKPAPPAYAPDPLLNKSLLRRGR
jgi:hypothetical protein